LRQRDEKSLALNRGLRSTGDMTHTRIRPIDALAALWREARAGETTLDRVRLTGTEPVLPSSFSVGTAAQASIAAASLAAAELFRLRTGRAQQVNVDMRHAAVECRSERYLRIDGKPGRDLWDPIAGTYRCGDGRWVRLHTNLPHHRDGTLALLKCAHDRAAVQATLDGWEGVTLETAAAEAGLVITAMRSFAEWDEHPQGRALSGLPVLTIEKIGDAPVEKLPAADRPLDRIRVLDLTRIIAGPVCGRTLAAHGAEVLLVTAAHLPSLEVLVIDSGRGKLSTALDLRQLTARNLLAELLREAHVFVQGYRPGAIAARGFGPGQAAQMRPGIVYVTLSAYGHEGPWSGRRGFDSLVQTASGFNHAEAEAAGVAAPKPLPAQMLDHCSGYLMAFGAMIALARRTTEGGSWHVRVSLAQTGRWIRGLGRVEGGLTLADPRSADVADLMEEMPSGFGTLRSVRHAGILSETPATWTRPSVPLGTHAPRWDNRD
jgi:crotonobetainyl-CoA:carnitine CoA-transferase CaiB-like acyl-CoA transferase